MITIIGVAVALLVVGAIIFFVLGRNRGELPPEASPDTSSREPKKTEPAKKAEPAKPESKRDDKRPSDKPAKKDEKKPEKKVEAPKDEKKAEATPALVSEEPKPEPKAEAKPEAKTEAKPEPKVEPTPEPKAEPKVAAPAAKPKAAQRGESVAALKKGLAETRGGFIARLAQLFGRKKEIDPGLLDEIQAVLITADIGPRTTEKLLSRLRERMDRRELADADAVWKALEADARGVLGDDRGALEIGPPPTTILIVGVNGVGKTTTIGKLASRFRDDGKKVVLAAGDTFRAAAVVQLEVWGKRVGCPVVKGKERADPGSVIFDAIKSAREQGADVVLADTAGRLHTKSNLMEELKKVVRTAEKALERPVDHILLVLDATTGQNAIQQAQLFKEAIPVSGIVLTKLDGTAKGGVVLGIADEHGIPVRYVGIGERVEDLREFDPEGFVSALFEKPEESAS
jgi:fused signal recognition particle receptor